MDKAANPGNERQFVALLRGINVGGNSRVPMADLRRDWAAAGLADIRTYINSGNVIFTDPAGRTADELAGMLATRLEEDLGFPVAVLVIPAQRFLSIAAAIPDEWANDTQHKSDVIFLLPAADGPDALAAFTVKEGIDEVVHVPGAVLWRVTRPNQPRTGLLTSIGTPLYRQITVRNVNTVRKLGALLDTR